MEYAAWALYCYIVIQLINDGRQAKSKKQGSEPRGAYYYKIKGLIHVTIGLFGTIIVQLMDAIFGEYLPDTAIAQRTELMLVIAFLGLFILGVIYIAKSIMSRIP